jgi:hypothetical protein
MYSDQSEQPASNYIPRAAAVLQQIFEKILRPCGSVLNIKWKVPTQEMFTKYAHELPIVLNWFAHEGIRRGIPMRTFENKPLCEEDLSELEAWLATMNSVFIEDDATKKKTCIITNSRDNSRMVIKNDNEFIELFAKV